MNNGIKKSNIAYTIAHIWNNNYITEQLWYQTMNIASIKAELIAIHLDLISAITKNDTHNIIVITNSITTTSKSLNPMLIPFKTLLYHLLQKSRSF